MGHILLIGLWDLLTTFAECQVESKFTDAYLDGAGHSTDFFVFLIDRVEKSLRFFRRTILTTPFQSRKCGHGALPPLEAMDKGDQNTLAALSDS